MLLFFLVIKPIFGQINRGSENLIIQKKELLESEVKIENLHDFKANFKQYQPNLEKIDQLFISISEPVEFIEFLESEASNARLLATISPPALKGKNDDFWPSLEFALDIRGPSPNFLRFLDRLESAPYLIRTVNLSARKDPKIDNNIIAALSIRIYAK